MHEISVLNNALKTIEEVAKEQKVKSVSEIVLEVGELTGIVPGIFESFFPLLIDERPLFKEASLSIIIRPGRGLCLDCGNMYNIFKNEGCCPKCKSREKKIISGQDLIIKEIVANIKEEKEND